LLYQRQHCATGRHRVDHTSRPLTVEWRQVEASGLQRHYASVWLDDTTTPTVMTSPLSPSTNDWHDQRRSDNEKQAEPEPFARAFPSVLPAIDLDEMAERPDRSHLEKRKGSRRTSETADDGPERWGSSQCAR
jgi:hypothetical protein